MRITRANARNLQSLSSQWQIHRRIWTWYLRYRGFFSLIFTPKYRTLSQILFRDPHYHMVCIGDKLEHYCCCGLRSVSNNNTQLCSMQVFNQASYVIPIPSITDTINSIIGTLFATEGYDMQFPQSNSTIETYIYDVRSTAHHNKSLFYTFFNIAS